METFCPKVSSILTEPHSRLILRKEKRLSQFMG